MLVSTAAATDAIEGHALVIAYRATITLPAGVYSDLSMAGKSIQVDCQISSDVPQGSRFQPGYAARTATITINGPLDATDATKTAAWLFGNYQTTSPMYRKHALKTPVTIDVGVIVPGQLEPEWFRRFTGRVDTYQINPKTGDVSITCIDRRAELRSAVNTPPVITAPPYNAGLTNEAAVDWILRAASDGDISSWPAKRPHALLACGLRTTLWPETGALDTTQDQPVGTFKPGPYGSGLASSNTSSGWTAVTYVMANSLAATATDLFIEGLVSDLDAVGSGVSVDVGYLSSGAFIATMGFFIDTSGIRNASGTAGFAPPIGGGPHYASIKVRFHPSNYDITFTVDAATHTDTGVAYTVAGGPGVSGNWGSAQITAYGFGVVAGVQATTESAPASHYPFVPQAVLDPSLNPLTVVPAVTGDPMQAIQAIAQSEVAVAFFDDYGVFRYYNRTRLAGGTSSREIRASASLSDLSYQTTSVALYTRVQCTYTPWTFDPLQVVYNLTTLVEVPAHGSYTLLVNPTVGQLACALDGTVTVRPNFSSSTTTSLFRAASSKSGLVEHPGGLVWTVTQATSNQISITITNPTAVTAWLITPANYTDIPVGTPTLQIAGIPVEMGAATLVDKQWPPLNLDGSGGAASGPYGEILYTVPSNEWIQLPGPAGVLVDDTLSMLSTPKPIFTNMPIQPDPRSSICDRVHVIDLEVSGADEYALLWGWNLQLSNNQAAMTIAARAITAPGGWILGVAGRSELAETTFI